jgi:hypothetical protein
LRTALSFGQGAAQELVRRQLPINRNSGPALTAAASLVLAHPQLMLVLKYFGYFAGLFLCLRGLDRWIVSPRGRGYGSEPAPLRNGIMALFLSLVVIFATEPFLLQAAPASEYRLRLQLLAPSVVAATPAAAAQSLPPMNASTLISIAVFALLQVMMYFICLQKINQISQEQLPPLLKLRLMENEENLFDSGLYVGMMGTAAALCLQVLGVIEPNLLAAYSSNLFGIVCVALVKIRHVRGFKRRLIMEHEESQITA